MGKKLNVSAEIHIPQPVIQENGHTFNEGNYYILEVEMAISYIDTAEGIKILDTTITGYTKESLKRLMDAIGELKDES